MDSIMVVVDQLTKRAHFVACKTTDTAQRLAELYRDHIFAHHGIPVEIISDRDPKFTSNMWKSLCSTISPKANNRISASSKWYN
ncbi:LOW QUALITY PROTEIN: Retrotransposable element [Phytophthora palmivora]|uniref:Retrotransposable element n=1 Tax=Phytophthora palmivora TaxID=4796 RepID=A0A2P4WYV6_9STRA|nr:LOW QUALITY PROTEIN: Retrotransposable element [Phytophthora palmivora]